MKIEAFFASISIIEWNNGLVARGRLCRLNNIIIWATVHIKTLHCDNNTKERPKDNYQLFCNNFPYTIWS